MGCNNCPLNRIHPSIHKVKNLKRVIGRKAMLWAQSPGKWENLKRSVLVGDSGKLVWSTARLAGLTRKDFDLQNVVRCWPVDVDEFKEVVTRHTPTKEEVRCCSVYNEEALERNKGEAVVHLVLGDVAGKSALGKNYRKDRSVFWHSDWNAYVLTTYHPSYILRLGGENKAGFKYEEFKAKVCSIPYFLDNPGRFGYVFNRPFVQITKDNIDWLSRKVDWLYSKGRVVGTDFEWDGDRALVMSLSWGRHDKLGNWKGKIVSIPLDHSESPNLDSSIISQWVKWFMEHPVTKTLHYGKPSDVAFCERKYGAKTRGFDRDSMYIAFFKYSDLKRYGLENLGSVFFPEYGDWKLIPSTYGDVNEHGRINFSSVPLDKLASYNCIDSEVSSRIDDRFFEERTKGLGIIYINASNTFSRMEKTGPWLDDKACTRLEESLPKKIDKLRERLRIIVGNPNYNPGSHVQIAKFLYRNTGGVGPTSKDVLNGLITQGDKRKEFLQGTIDYRKWTKEYSTYVKNYRLSASMHDGQLRTVWNMTGTGTGRGSSGGRRGEKGYVNLQNLHGDPELEDLLISDPNWEDLWNCYNKGNLDRYWKDYLGLKVFSAADYGQIEVRILAHASGDSLLIRQFHTGRDIHCQVGHEVTGWSEEEIAKERTTRTAVKSMHFGIIYGMKDLHKYLLSEGINISKKEADRRLKRYFARYKGVRRFIDRMISMAERLGYAENILGFRRHISMVESATGGYWANQAINTPIQGAAHQLLMLALGMVDIQRDRFNYLQEPVMDVHDSLIFYSTVKDLRRTTEQQIMLMEQGVPDGIENIFGWKLKVPLVAEGKAGLKYNTLVKTWDGSSGVYGLSPKSFLFKWCKEYKKVRDGFYKA